MLLLSRFPQTTAFFQYHTDCDGWCQRQSLPCVIDEVNPEYFPCACYETESGCQEKASRAVVCLLPDGRVFGGEDIWVDYYNFTHHNPPTPKPSPPKPSPQGQIPYLVIYAVMVTTALAIRIGVDICICVDQMWRRRRYEQLSNADRVRSAGVPLSPESPYSQQGPSTQSGSPNE